MTARNTLPQRRECETFELRHGGQNTPYQVTLGYYENSKLGEVFISGAKAGSGSEAITRDAAIVLSISLQHGVPIAAFKHITRESNGTPSTIIGAVIDRLAE